MKLAVNYSTALAALLRQGVVQTDLIKCPEWDNLVDAGKALGAVTVHFEIAIGNGSLKKLDFELIGRMLATTDTPHLNTHLSAALGMQANLKADQKRLPKAWARDLKTLRKAFPGVDIVCENLPYVPFLPHLELSAQPELISNFLNDADAGFILDISHARITAANLGWDPHETIARLPMARLRELHVTGIRRYAGLLTDHFELQEEDWRWMDWAHRQISTGAWHHPRVVAFEYGGVGEIFAWRTQKEHLRAQLPRLYALFGQSPQA